MRAKFFVAAVVGSVLAVWPVNGQSGGATISIASGALSITTQVGQGGRTGMPYSAEQTTEMVQTLADGTHITQSNRVTKLYRDSEGRTRTEHSFPPPPGVSNAVGRPMFVTIWDPVAAVTYNLNENKHTATRNVMPTMSQFNRAEGAARATRSSATDTQRTKLFVRTDPAFANEPAQANRPHTVREDLGNQVTEGVSADGTRTTTTYPEGSVGNDRPFTVIQENWMSHELGMMVLSKSSDPRSGETITKLTNISRSEPDPALFQVPSDYTIEEQPQHN